MKKNIIRLFEREIMLYQPCDHTFAICAYKESPYLEECISSLMSQTIKSNVIVCTSTPCRYIETLAMKYQLEVFVNESAGGIAEDWNFAYKSAATALVTLAHQDDIYEPDYLQRVLEKLNNGKNTLICFTDYFEIQDGKRIYADQFLNLRFKQLLLTPLRSKKLQANIWLRRRILSFGNPIGCPSVTYVKKHLPEKLFQPRFKSNLDWQTWEMLSKRKGRFLYIHSPLMGHRMHQESTTLKLIGESGDRTEEDYQMFCAFWPKPIAEMICRMYAKSQENRLNRQIDLE